MANPTDRILIGYLLDETVSLSLAEMSGACRVREERIVELVEEGIIEPVAEQREWHFPATQLQRAHRAIRLQQDLEINLAGVAVVLDLLEELEELRARFAGL